MFPPRRALGVVALLLVGGQACISEARALQIAKEEYLRTVLIPDSVRFPGLVICADDPLHAYAFEEPTGFRVIVSVKEACLGKPMLDGEGRYFVSKSGVLIRSSTREEADAAKGR